MPLSLPFCINQSPINHTALCYQNCHAHQLAFRAAPKFESGISRLHISLTRRPWRKMDPRRWVIPRAKQLTDLTSHASVESRSWVTRFMFVSRTWSSKLRIRAKGARFTTWLIVLLLPAVPAGFIIKYSNQIPVATFTSNFIAMVPLGAISTLLTDELIVRRGGHQALLVVVTAGFVASTLPKIEGDSLLTYLND